MRDKIELELLKKIELLKIRREPIGIGKDCIKFIILNERLEQHRETKKEINEEFNIWLKSLLKLGVTLSGTAQYFLENKLSKC
jgi:hypothetical protein